jgi:cob(I)alamin adenosyltransferase
MIEMKIYTKQGGGGMSVLFDGQRVLKDHLRLETYGTVDELNSHLGVAATECADAGSKALIVALQGELLELGSDLATPAGSANEGKVKRIGPERAKALEELIDAATGELAPLKRFILPGGSVTASRLHVARTVCRRAERLLVTLMGQEGVTGLEDCLVYLNRLSDLLFMWARLANKRAGVGDIEWKTNQ